MTGPLSTPLFAALKHRQSLKSVLERSEEEAHKLKTAPTQRWISATALSAMPTPRTVIYRLQY
jgi:hypothetical protein